MLHKKDKALLEQIQKYFGIGKTYLHKDAIHYQVFSFEDIQIIIEHFDNNPLITQKHADFLLFKKAFYLIKKKEHLTKEGLEQIIAIRASMNNGLSDLLKASFPNVIPTPRLVVVDQTIKDPH